MSSGNKKINYVWFGLSEKSDLINICINSWREKYSDYEIIEWNELNIHLIKGLKENIFFKECLKRQLWAYAADVARVYILNQEGGIYFDTDIQVLKKFEPKINILTIGFEDGKHVNGAVIYSPKNNEIIQKLVSFYEVDIWHCNIFTLPDVMTRIIKLHCGFIALENKTVKLDDIIIFNSDYFYPYHYLEKFDYKKITDKAYTIHWWGKSWHTNDARLNFLRYKHIKGVKKVIVNFLVLTKLINCLRGKAITTNIKRLLGV
ncbi:hypothetical protein MT391_11645 [Vibrio sp. 1-Bac 57]